MLETLVGIDEIRALKAKYLEERDKRLRPDGVGQYREVDFAHGEYGRDPFAETPVVRDAVTRAVDVLVVGAGHGGLLACDALVREGIEDFLIVEKASGLGGTWYWNRYPGCRCDIEAAIYMPLLEDGGAMPTERYVRSGEIRANAQRIGEKLGLFDKALLETAVSTMDWDADAARWIVTTDRGDTIRARFVCLGSGPMSRPKLPGIPGIEDFKGKMFHTSRWDYDYTGGDETGGLTGLADKRVAVIGTGATGVQVIPQVAKYAGHLYVVQRTPAAVDDRKNALVESAWWEALQPGWWERRATNFASIHVSTPDPEDMVDDTWTRMFAQFNEAYFADPASTGAPDISPAEFVDHQIMAGIRAKIDERVKDKKTAEGLKPWYNFYCKRPLYLDGYYETFNRPNVTLIDTQGRSLDRVTDNAIVFDGVEYPVDCIIFASGFEVAVPLDRAGGLELVGRDGATLKHHWADGMRSVHGMFVHGFPNMGFIGGVRQAAFSWNVTYNLKRQGDHFAKVLRHFIDSGARTFEATREAEDKWLAEMARGSNVDVQFLADCTPGYLNNEGRDVGGGIASEGYGPGVLEYARLLREWRDTAIDEDMTADQGSLAKT